LAAACSAVVQARKIAPTSRLNEALLRSYLCLGLLPEFEKLFKEAEDRKQINTNTSALALRAAVTAGDLQKALRRLPPLASAWRLTAASTPSAAHSQIFQQLVRLAVQDEALDQLCEALQKEHLLLPWTVEALLVESLQHGNTQVFCKVKELAAECKVPLTAGASAVLISAAKDARGAVQAFSEADALGLASEKEVLLAACTAAKALGDAALATLAMDRLAGGVEREVAAAAMHLCAPGAPLAGQDSDAAVLKLFTGSLKSMPDLGDVAAERLVVEAALRSGAREVLEMMLTATETGSSRQVAVIKSFAAERRLKDCFKVFEACPVKTSVLYNALLDACIDSSDVSAAEGVMRRATAAGLADIVTYNTMLKAHLQSGSSRRARATVETMRKAGVTPNVVTFNELIDATIRERGDVWGIVGEMRQDGLKPNRVTASILMKNVQRSSHAADMEKAFAVVEDMESAMDEVLLSSICEACIRTGRWDLLEKQLGKQQGPSAVIVRGAHTYGSIIRAFGFTKNIDGVWRTWQQMQEQNITPTSVTLGCMVEALVANGKIDAGYKLIRTHMDSPQLRPLVNAVIYCSVLKGYSHHKRFERVWPLYEEMKAASLQFSIVTYNTLIDACSRSGDMCRIPLLLEEMSACNIVPNIITYSTIIKGYCQVGKIDNAFELLDEMQGTLGVVPDEVAYNTILDGCARFGMWARGMALFNKMQEAGVPPSNFTLCVLVKLANRCNRKEEAFQMTEELCKKYSIRLNTHVFNNLIHACTGVEDLRGGLQVLERMLSEKARPDSRTYKLLLKACIIANEPTQAAGLLRGAAGLRGIHPSQQGAPKHLLQPSGGLISEVVTETIEGIARECGEETLAVQLLKDLRDCSGVQVDRRLPMKLASKASKASKAQHLEM